MEFELEVVENVFLLDSLEVLETLEAEPEIDESGTVYTYRASEGEMNLTLYIHIYDGDVEFTLERRGVELVSASFLQCSSLRVVKEKSGELLEFYVSEPNPSSLSDEKTERKVGHLGVKPYRVLISRPPRGYL